MGKQVNACEEMRDGIKSLILEPVSVLYKAQQTKEWKIVLVKQVSLLDPH